MIGVEDLGEIQVRPNDPLYYLKNTLGSITSITNMNAGIIDSNCFGPYGEPLDPVAKNARLTNSPYGFTGESHDIEGGLVYLRARYYEPGTMRFLQQDTLLGDIKEPLSRNLYIYGNANPLKYVDPSGHKPLLDIDEDIYPISNIDDEVASENYARTHPIIKPLRIGSTGTYVSVLQKELAYRGYFALPSTASYGYYGHITYSSVWDYQEINGLKRDGEVYEEVWKSLFPQAYNSSSNERVKDPTPSTPLPRADEGTDKLTLTDEMEKAGVKIVVIDSKQYYDYSEPINTVFWNAAVEASKHKGDLIWFKSKVNHSADWDIKRKEPWEKTVGTPFPESYDAKIIVNGSLTTPEELGNMMYGYTGTAANISESVLIAGSMYAAGILGIITNKDKRTNEFNDHDPIRKGIQWYKKDKKDKEK